MNNKLQNISEEEFEQIERYLLNEMSIHEKQTFEVDLSHSKTLREHVEQQRQFIHAVKEHALKKKLDHFHEQMELEANANKTQKTFRLDFRNRKFSIAASIVVLIGLGSIWVFNRPSFNEQLFNEYFTPDPGLPTVMGSEAENFEFLDAMIDYKQGHYEKAIQKWETLLPQKSTNDTLNYFLGVSYLADRKYGKAISFLEKTILQNNSTFKNEAFFYLGISYLKKNDLEAAKENLKKTSLKKSREILNALEP